MRLSTIVTSTLSVAALTRAAPATAEPPPELEALFRELRDYRCETGGINARSIYTPQAGKCLKFKNKDTAGVKLTYLKEKCNLLVYLDEECKDLGITATRALCVGDDIQTYGSAIVECQV